MRTRAVLAAQGGTGKVHDRGGRGVATASAWLT